MAGTMNDLTMNTTRARQAAIPLLVPVLLLVLLIPSCSGGKTAVRPAEPDRAAQLLDRSVAARGGLEAFRALTTRVAAGRSEIEGVNPAADFTEWNAWPDRSLAAHDYPGYGMFEEGADGREAWYRSALYGEELYEGEERQYRLRRSLFDREVHWRRNYRQAELTGTAEVEGRPCHRIELTAPGGEVVVHYLDMETLLPARTDYQEPAEIGGDTEETLYDDYHEVDGVLLAHRRRIVSGGRVTTETFNSIEHNADPGAGRFTPPNAVKRLISEREARTRLPVTSLEEKAAWIRKHSVVLETVDPNAGLGDLEPLRQLVGDARIVALGEGTHGTREFFLMKHRITRFLAEEMGFTIFAIEANMPEARRINDFVMGGEDDPIQLLGGLYCWPWNTEEVLELIRWMREFNHSGRRRMAFTGFDMQRPTLAMAMVEDFAERHDPGFAGRIKEVYGQARQAAGRGAASPFGVASSSFPVVAAAGKRVCFSGWIRTDEIDEGYAGLWWRVDGPFSTLGFDNMLERGPRGTTPWSRYEIEMDVDPGATAIRFGVLHQGGGRAWFDNLTIELDDTPFADEALDLDFESGGLAGFKTAGAEFRIETTDEHPRSGARCLRSEHTECEEREPLDSMDLAQLCAEVLAHLEGREDSYLEHAPAEQVAWAVQCARLVYQSYRGNTGGEHRDISMAENVRWILEQAPPETRIVLWAHNGHVSRVGQFMGGVLDEWYGDEMVVVGFTCAEGEYTAAENNQPGVHPLAPPVRESVEERLAAAGLPMLILDLRCVSTDDPESAWLTSRPRLRSIGAVAQDHQFYRTAVSRNFDLLVFVERTTPTRLLSK